MGSARDDRFAIAFSKAGRNFLPPKKWRVSNNRVKSTAVLREHLRKLKWPMQGLTDWFAWREIDTQGLTRPINDAVKGVVFPRNCFTGLCLSSPWDSDFAIRNRARL